MPKSARAAAIVGAWALLGAQPAWAACTATLTVSNIDISWDLSYTYQAVTYTITKTSDPACDYGIAFSRGGAATYSRRMVNGGGVPLPYQLFKDASLTQVLRYAGDITSNNEAILGSFAAGVVAPQNFTFYLQVPLSTATAPAFKPYGAYTDTFDVSAYEGTDPVQFVTPITTSSVTLTTTIPKIVQIYIGSFGAAFDPAATSNTIAFGNLNSGMIAQRELKVRTNAGYSVTFSSANHGTMAHTDPLVTTQVPYTLSANAVALDLSGAASAPTLMTGQTSIEGNSNPLLVRIGNIDSALSGTYADSITVNVSSTD